MSTPFYINDAIQVVNSLADIKPFNGATTGWTFDDAATVRIQYTQGTVSGSGARSDVALLDSTTPHLIAFKLRLPGDLKTRLWGPFWRVYDVSHEYGLGSRPMLTVGTNSRDATFDAVNLRNYDANAEKYNTPSIIRSFSGLFTYPGSDSATFDSEETLGPKRVIGYEYWLSELRELEKTPNLSMLVWWPRATKTRYTNAKTFDMSSLTVYDILNAPVDFMVRVQCYSKTAVILHILAAFDRELPKTSNSILSGKNVTRYIAIPILNQSASYGGEKATTSNVRRSHLALAATVMRACGVRRWPREIRPLMDLARDITLASAITRAIPVNSPVVSTKPSYDLPDIPTLVRSFELTRITSLDSASSSSIVNANDDALQASKFVGTVVQNAGLIGENLRDIRNLLATIGSSLNFGPSQAIADLSQTIPLQNIDSVAADAIILNADVARFRDVYNRVMLSMRAVSGIPSLLNKFMTDYKSIEETVDPTAVGQKNARRLDAIKKLATAVLEANNENLKLTNPFIVTLKGTQIDKLSLDETIPTILSAIAAYVSYCMTEALNATREILRPTENAKLDAANKQISDLTRRLVDTNKKSKEWSAFLLLRKAELSEKATLLQRAQATAEDLKKRLDMRETEQSESNSKLTEFTRELGKKNVELSEAKAAVSTAQAELSTARAALDAAQAERGRLEAEINKNIYVLLKNDELHLVEIKKFQQTIEDQKASLETFKATAKADQLKLLDDFAKKKDQVDILVATNRDLSSKLRQLDIKQSLLEDQLTEAENRVRATERDAESAKQEYTNQLTQIKRADDDRIAALEDEKRKLQETLDAVSAKDAAEIARLGTELSFKQFDLEAARARKDSETAILTKDIQRLKAELDAVKTDRDGISASLEEKIRKVQTELSAAQVESSSNSTAAGDEIRKLQEELDSVRTDRDIARRFSDENASELQKARANLQELEAGKELLLRTLNRAEKAALDLEDLKESAVIEMMAARKSLEELRELYEKLKVENVELQSANKKIPKLEEANKFFEAEVKILTENFDAAVKDVDGLGDDLRNARKKVAQLEAEKTALSADLDKTRENLERVESDANEAVDQMAKQLETNAKLAEQNIDLLKKVKVLDEVSAAKAKAEADLATATSALTDATQKITTLESQLASTVTDRDRLDAEFKTTQASLEKIRAELVKEQASMTFLRKELQEKTDSNKAISDLLDRSERRVAELQAAIAVKEQSLVDLRKGLSDANQRISVLTIERDALNVSVKDIQTRLDVANVENSRLTAELDDMLVTNTALEAERDRLKGESARLTDKHKKATDRIAELVKTTKDLTKANAELSLKKTELEGNVAALEIQLNGARARISDLETEVRDLTDKFTQAQADLAAKDAEITDLKVDITAKDGEIASLNTEVAAQQAEIANLTSQVAVLEQDVDNLELKLATVTEEKRQLKTQVDADRTIITNLSAEMDRVNQALSYTRSELDNGKVEQERLKKRLNAIAKIHVDELDTIRSLHNTRGVATFEKLDPDADNFKPASIVSQISGRRGRLFMSPFSTEDTATRSPVEYVPVLQFFRDTAAIRGIKNRLVAAGVGGVVNNVLLETRVKELLSRETPIASFERKSSWIPLYSLDDGSTVAGADKTTFFKDVSGTSTTSEQVLQFELTNLHTQLARELPKRRSKWVQQFEDLDLIRDTLNRAARDKKLPIFLPTLRSVSEENSELTIEERRKRDYSRSRVPMFLTTRSDSDWAKLDNPAVFYPQFKSDKSDFVDHWTATPHLRVMTRDFGDKASKLESTSLRMSHDVVIPKTGWILLKGIKQLWEAQDRVVWYDFSKEVVGPDGILDVKASLMSCNIVLHLERKDTERYNVKGIFIRPEVIEIDSLLSKRKFDEEETIGSVLLSLANEMSDVEYKYTIKTSKAKDPAKFRAEYTKRWQDLDELAERTGLVPLSDANTVASAVFVVKSALKVSEKEYSEVAAKSAKALLDFLDPRDSITALEKLVRVKTHESPMAFTSLWAYLMTVLGATGKIEDVSDDMLYLYLRLILYGHGMPAYDRRFWSVLRKIGDLGKASSIIDTCLPSELMGTLYLSQNSTEKDAEIFSRAVLGQLQKDPKDTYGDDYDAWLIIRFVEYITITSKWVVPVVAPDSVFVKFFADFPVKLDAAYPGAAAIRGKTTPLPVESLAFLALVLARKSVVDTLLVEVEKVFEETLKMGSKKLRKSVKNALKLLSVIKESKFATEKVPDSLHVVLIAIQQGYILSKFAGATDLTTLALKTTIDDFSVVDSAVSAKFADVKTILESALKSL